MSLRPLLVLEHPLHRVVCRTKGRQLCHVTVPDGSRRIVRHRHTPTTQECLAVVLHRDALRSHRLHRLNGQDEFPPVESPGGRLLERVLPSEERVGLRPEPDRIGCGLLRDTLVRPRRGAAVHVRPLTQRRKKFSDLIPHRLISGAEPDLVVPSDVPPPVRVHQSPEKVPTLRLRRTEVHRGDVLVVEHTRLRQESLELRRATGDPRPTKLARVSETNPQPRRALVGGVLHNRNRPPSIFEFLNDPGFTGPINRNLVLGSSPVPKPHPEYVRVNRQVGVRQVKGRGQGHSQVPLSEGSPHPPGEVPRFQNLVHHL